MGGTKEPRRHSLPIRLWTRGSAWLETTLPIGGDTAVMLVAIGLSLAGAAVVVSTGGATSTTDVLFTAFMDVGLAVGAVYGAVALRRTFSSPRIRWLVAVWYLSGIALLWILYTWANLTALLTTATTILDLSDGYVLFGNLGGLLGLVAGFNRGRAAQNRQLVDELEARTDTLEFINYMLRHNILNGTQQIQGYAALLAEEADLSDERRAYVENIRDGGERITELANNVRLLMETVTEDVSPTRVELSELVMEEIDHARTRYPEARFEADIQPGVAAEANEMLPHAVANLLQNAVEHNDADQPVVTVEVTSDSQRAYVTVADNGPGFPDTLKERAFDVEESDPLGRGIEVGLYLVQVIVEASDGSASIEDADGGGAAITIELSLPAEFRA